MKMDPAQNSPISTNGIDDIPNDPGLVGIRSEFLSCFLD